MPGGNFVNLLVQLSQGETLIGKDFSKMIIWQAYLQKVKLQEVSFNRCELDRSVFTETFSDVMAIAFSHTFSRTRQPLLAAGDASGVMHLWPTSASKASSQKLTQTCAQKFAQWSAHSGWVRAIAFVPNQSLLVTGGDDNWLRLWRLPINSSQGLSQPTQVWQKSAYDWVHAVAVSDDGAVIASGGDDQITLYRTRDGRLINRFADPAGESPQSQAQSHAQPQAQSHAKGRIRALAFSPNGRWLAGGGDDYIVRIWSVNKLLQSADEAQSTAPG